MSAITDAYFTTLIERLADLRDRQAAAIDRAAGICADSIAADKLVFTFGTGHGALPAIETFPRTGTIVGFRPIVESTMISFHRVWGDMGARQYRFIHAVEGYGKAILRSHQLDPQDSLVLFSHSGVNAVILDIALGAQEKGLKVIGVTSLAHSSATNSRHSSASACSRSPTSSSTPAPASPTPRSASTVSRRRSARIRPASPSRSPTPSSRRLRSSWCGAASNRS